MKELSTEQKAKAYDGAVKVIRDNLDALNEITETGAEIVNIQAMKNCFYRAFPELKESENEQVKKAIIELVKQSSEILSKQNQKDMLAWLEKQKNRSPLSKDEEYTLARIIEYLDDNNCPSEWKDLLHDVYVLPYQKEQKPADKVEPKFKVGDWITNGDYTWKIVDVMPLDYALQSQDGNTVVDTISYVDEQFHSFTIEDAKGGDVVADETDGVIGIFQSIGNHPDGGSCNDPSYCFLHCRYDDGFFYADFENGNTIDSYDLIPATKEQHNILMKAMKDAGYTFDFEKKELKKIEDEPTWGEEDESYLNTTTAYLKDAKEFKKTAENCIDWLKSLKQRLGGEK